MSVDELAHIGKPFDLKTEKGLKIGWYSTIRSFAEQGQPVKSFKDIQKKNIEKIGMNLEPIVQID